IITGGWNRSSPGGAISADIAQALGPIGVDRVVVASALLCATFFALRNWSRQTDESRPARFRLRSLLATVFVAWFSGALFGVMSSSLVTWAAIISATVQLSSVWRPDQAAKAA
ncbi:MAG TPA: hypothetical protein VM452_13730, partial [Caulifigura sp.]|nr:hypothetical protein [Caulifigura sp.]